jgi:hypothetical protein
MERFSISRPPNFASIDPNFSFVVFPILSSSRAAVPPGDGADLS